MAGNVSDERRGVPWGVVFPWTTLIVVVTSYVFLLCHNARITRALAARPGGIDTVYVERYWGMTYHTTKPGGVLVVEFQQVKTGGKK
jgi:hypothetical protein